MKLISGFIYIGLITVFMAISTGIHLTRHTCLASGHSFLVMDQDFSCCDHGDVLAGMDAITGDVSGCCAPDDAMSAPAATCCETENTACELDSNSGADPVHASTQHEDCCVDQHQYLKSEEDYSKPGKMELPSVKTHLLLATLSEDRPLIRGNRPESRSPDPPPVLCEDPLISKGVLLL